MKKIYKNIIILSILLAGLIAGCKSYTSAFGSERQIYVFADSLLWLQIKPQVAETFHSFIYTPRAERSFLITWKPLSKLGAFKDRLNLLFIGTTQDQNQVNDYINKIVPQEFLDNVNENKSFHFFKDDLFAQDQISMFMIAKDSLAFKRNFDILKNDIFDGFQKRYLARLGERMFKRDEQFDLEEILVKEYGYKVKVQHDYFIANQNLDEKYVWLRRLDPDRWISIWRIASDSSIFNKDSLIKVRNEMTKKYYDGDVVVETETDLGLSNLKKREVHKLTGTWRNDSLYVGGPFRMYVIPNEQEDSLYLLDIAVMAPTKDKKPFLDQLEVIASTFTFVNKKESQKQ